METMHAPKIQLSDELSLDKSKHVCFMIHGVFGMATNLTGLAKSISHLVHPIPLDIPNHGDSDTLENCNFIEMAQILDRTIKSYKFSNKKIHLIGHSLGAKIAMTYCLLYPEEISSLVIMDIAPKTYPPTHTNIIKAFQQIEATKPPTRPEAVEIFTSLEVDLDTANFLAKSCVYGEKGYEGNKIRIDEIAKNYETLLSFPFDEVEGKKYTAPTLVLRAEHTIYFSEDDVYLVDKYFPSWEIETVSNSGHNIHIDNLIETKEYIEFFYRDFL